MSKLNAKQERKIKKFEKRWGKQAKPANDFYKKYVKKSIREGIESMMYMKKPKDKVEKIWNEIIWFLKIVIIFLALSQITDFITGRWILWKQNYLYF